MWQTILSNWTTWLPIVGAILVVLLPDGAFKNIITKILSVFKPSTDNPPVPDNNTLTPSTDGPLATFIKLITQLGDEGQTELVDELAPLSTKLVRRHKVKQKRSTATDVTVTE